jgi:hypothetical protein
MSEPFEEERKFFEKAEISNYQNKGDWKISEREIVRRLRQIPIKIPPPFVRHETKLPDYSWAEKWNSL